MDSCVRADRRRKESEGTHSDLRRARFGRASPSCGSGRKSQDGGPHSTEAAKNSVNRSSTHGDEVNKAWHGDPEAWDAAEAGTPARHWRRRRRMKAEEKAPRRG